MLTCFLKRSACIAIPGSDEAIKSITSSIDHSEGAWEGGAGLGGGRVEEETGEGGPLFSVIWGSHGVVEDAGSGAIGLIFAGVPDWLMLIASF